MESAWISCYRVFFTFRRLMSLSPSLRNTQLLSSGSTSGRSPREKLQLLRSMYFHWPCSTDPFIPQSQLLLGHSAHPPPVSRCRVHPALPPHKCCDRTPGKVRYPCLKPAAELTTTWSSSDQGYIYRTSSQRFLVSLFFWCFFFHGPCGIHCSVLLHQRIPHLFGFSKTFRTEVSQRNLKKNYVFLYWHHLDILVAN